MPRPIWTGVISFGLVTVPVELYPAEVRDELAFHLVDRRNAARVHSRRVNEKNGEEVPWEEVAKAYEDEDGRMVLLDEEDFEQADVEAGKTVEIKDFVKAEAISPAYFDKPYYLLPAAGGEKGYVLLRETLKRTGTAGVALVVIRTRQYLAALLPQGPALVLDLMRFAHELRDLSELSFPAEDLSAVKVQPRELELAENLIGSMTVDFKPGTYKDEYRQKLLALIHRKLKAGGKALPRKKAPAAAPAGKVVDMMGLLKKSLEQKQKGKPASRKAAPKRKAG